MQMGHNNNYLVILSLISTLLLLLLVLLSSTAWAVSDGEILLQFKKSLSNVTVLANWNTSVPICVGHTNSSNWRGLTCMNGNLYGLRLENMGLSGRIDVETLVKLSISLRSLSVKGNHFGGEIPQLRLLGALRSLYLSNNEFSGVIPDDTFEGMAYLKKVHLARNEFDGVLPTSLVRLSKLVELDLEDNRFTGMIPEFAHQDWKELSFANNQFEGPIPATLTNIDPRAFLGNKGLCGPPLGSCKSSSNKKHIVIIAIIVTVVVAVIALILFLSARRAISRSALQLKKLGWATKVSEQFGAAAGDAAAQSRSDHGYKKGGEKGSLHFVMKERERFELEDLLRASAEVLGSGSFGSSYKALLLSGPAMVVKRFSQMNNVGRKEFHDYMAKLGRLSHPNLLPLVAYYYRKEEKLLISDFLENGSLASHLHGKRAVGKAGLDWPTRLNIIKGVSRGLTYLYKGFPDVALPHGHLKSSNILLDRNCTPILTEYALVPLTNRDHAHRFMAAFKSPEFSSNRVSRKTDVWSLGILILEILTGKFPENYLKPADGNRSLATDLAAWVNSVVREEWTGEVFDKEIRGGEGEGEMLKLLKIGMSCCERRVEQRLDWREAADRIQELRERDSEEEDYSSYVTDWDVLTDDGFSFSLKH